jgi:FKBP-type peptidyl-prolyl cis-trans isomerase SlyD
MSDQIVADNKVVSFTYKILNENGEVIEQSDLPFSYVHGGKHEMFDKVVQELEGCIIGQDVMVPLSPAEGFGEHDPGLTYTDDIGNVPPEFHRIGAEVEMVNDEGEARKFIVSAIENGKLTVDGNPPLAGKNITFNIKVVDIRDATPDEIANGVPPIVQPVMH